MNGDYFNTLARLVSERELAEYRELRRILKSLGLREILTVLYRQEDWRRSLTIQRLKELIREAPWETLLTLDVESLPPYLAEDVFYRLKLVVSSFTAAVCLDMWKTYFEANKRIGSILANDINRRIDAIDELWIPPWFIEMVNSPDRYPVFQENVRRKVIELVALKQL